MNVPYISSVVRASCFDGTWTAEWLLGQSFAIVPVGSSLPQPLGNTFGTAVGSRGFWSQTGRFVGSVISLLFSDTTVPGGILFPVQFDAVRGPTGALLIGDAETVAEKILRVNEVLGGLSRITFQMGVSALPHEMMLRSIELLGTQVVPLVRKELTAKSSPSLVS